jgi:lysophospholipase L1-like esterase
MTASPPASPAPASPPPARRGGILRLLATQAAIIVLLLLTLELIARLAGYGKRVQYFSRGELLWAPVPNQVAGNLMTNRRVTIDARGMRIVPGAPDDANRRQVLCLGNSVTFGFGVADTETYEAVLQRGLEARAPGRWRILNGGVIGYNMYFERLRLAQLTSLGVRPDLIVVGYCFNDVSTWPGEHYPAADREKVKASIVFKNRLRSIAVYNFLNDKFVTPELFAIRNKFLPGGIRFGPTAARTGSQPSAPSTAAPALPDTGWRADWLGYFGRQVGTTIAAARGAGAPVVAVVWPDPKHKNLPMRERFMDVCRANDVPFVDLQPLVEGRKLPYFDAIHPDAESFRVLVNEGILPFILSEGARRDSADTASAAAGGR